MKKLRVALILALMALIVALTACHSDHKRRMSITVGSADTPEQLILGKLTVLTLETGGYDVIDKTGLGSPWVVRAALEKGSVDIGWNYTGDTWTVYLAHDQPISDPVEMYQAVRKADALNQITWLSPAPCQHTMGLIMRKDAAAEKGLTKIGKLGHYMRWVDPDFSLCTPRDRYVAAGGIHALERVYNMSFKEDRVYFMPMQEGYTAVIRGDCDCAVGFSTDIATRFQELMLLQDDLGFFQASKLAVAVRTPVLQELPGLESRLGMLSELLSQEAMADLSRKVILENKKPEAVAKQFLKAHDLLTR